MLIFSLVCAPLSPLYARQNPADPLDNAELRDTLLRLNQLPLAWQENDLLRKALADETNLHDRETEVANREAELEKQKTALAEKETAVEHERAEFYKQAFERLTKGRGFGCALKKVVTFGLAHCG
jgi:predicted  nucleic acid-binding Zn-ribbon protein